MGKVCLACGIAPVEIKKPVTEPEDCVDCGGKDTVEEQKTEDDHGEKAD